MQTTACLPVDRLRALLADELAASDEATAAAHLAGCLHCQKAAEQLADDPAARALQAEHRRARQRNPSLASLDELRERLHVLGWFTSDSGNGHAASPDGGSTFAAKNGDTAGSTSAEQAAAETAITCVGKFQIVQPIGAGGFGVVYLARDQVLHRQVALKLARTSVLGDPDLKSRFLREAEALARLQHPHIIPVYEAGEHEGTCYLAVGYCDGPTLEQWLRQQDRPMTPRQAAELAMLLALAVEHAHQSGVLHRDIKPSNILLDHPTGTNQSPGSFPFVPKLTDFGLAKIAEHEGATTTIAGMLLGTPPYMAPEQAAGWSERIGKATDVYALGAVLYETLTGKPPIVGESNMDTLRRVLIDEPTPPNQLTSGIPDDLTAIALKCLDKSPTRRYAAAGDLAADLQRFLDGRPTIARPLSRSQRALRWIARNQAATIVTALAMLVLLLAGGVVFFNRRLARLQQEFELKNAEEAYCGEIAFAQERLKEEGDVVQAVEMLRRHLPVAGRSDLRGLEWHYLWTLTTRESYAAQSPGSELYQIGLSPDGQTLAAVTADATLYFYDAKTLAQQAVLRTDHREINGVCYSPSGEWIATVGDDGHARIWDAKSLTLVHDLPVHQGRAYQAVFYAGGTRLATCGEEPVIRLWNTTTWESDGVLEGHSLPVEALALSPDGSLLASVGDDRIGIVWDLATKSPKTRLADGEHTGRISCVAFSPDGAWIATGGQDSRVVLWRHERARRRSAGKHLDGVQSVAFTRDGRLIAGDRAGTIRTYSLGADFPKTATEEALERADETWHAHTGKVWSLAVLPESGRFVSAGGDGQIRAWQDESPIIRRWPAQGDYFYGIGYSRDGSQLLVLREASGIHAWDGRTGLSRFTLNDRDVKKWESMIVLPATKQVLAASQAGQFVLWNWQTLQRQQAWKQGDVSFQRLAYCPATDQLAAIAHDREDVLLLDARSGKLLASLPATSCTDCALSPDGTRLAVDTLNRLAIFDLATRKHVALERKHTQNINAIAYSPDGKLIATASSDRTVRLWTSDGQPVAGSLGHAGEVMAVAFTPNGQTLVTGGERGRVKLFHVPTRRELIEIETGMSKIRKLAVAPSNREIALLDDDWQLGLITLPKRPADD